MVFWLFFEGADGEVSGFYMVLQVFVFFGVNGEVSGFYNPG